MNIKETSEFLKGNLELLVFLISRMKDGTDFGDAVAVYQKITSDSEFRTLVIDAYEGIAMIKNEVVDIELSETIQLVNVFLAYLPKLVAAVK
jgi:hypothetical protein